MVRAGRRGDGQWYVGRGPGRGLWWCDAPDCASALGAAHVARALRLAPSEDDVAAVRALGLGASRFDRQ